MFDSDRNFVNMIDRHKKRRLLRRDRVEWAGWWVCTVMAVGVGSVRGERFTVGYITGSQRRPGDFNYPQPGLVISGAMSMAVDEVNEKLLGPMGHSLDFIVAETYGQEDVSIKQVAALWAANVTAFIGPQETCVHEGRMAAAFNLPMISYYCRDVESSNKKAFPTFARTRPADTAISRSLVAVLRHFKFMHVVFLYLRAPNHDFSRLAQAIISTAREHHVDVRAVREYRDQYFHNDYSRNPFLDIVRATYTDTRVYVSVGYYHDHIGLMLAMDSLKLLDNGEYVGVGVDVEQYSEDYAAKYLSGPFSKPPSPRVPFAFRSYLAVAPSPARAYPTFAREVNRRLQMPPFNRPAPPLAARGMLKEIPVEAAWLHDAVWVYARALAAHLLLGGDAHDGRAIATRMRNVTYTSVMGYQVHMDESGDAEGNYTLLAADSARPAGLYPLAIIHKNTPEISFLREMHWVGGRPPLSEPPCGFHGEKCINYVGRWGAGVAGGAVILMLLAGLALYRSWRYEQELDSLLWKIDFRDVRFPENPSRTDKANEKTDRDSAKQFPIFGADGAVRSSQVSLSSNPDLDFRYSAIFTEVGVYRNRLLAVKRVRKPHIDITREIKKELKIMRDLQHDNLNGFVGACTDPPNVCAISEYCTRGSLKDILENEDIKLDNMFVASLVGDIIRGMIFLHESPLGWHGALRPSNCLVDARWVVKLADYGLRAFRMGEEPPADLAQLQAQLDGLVYAAPERLRAAGWGRAGAWAEPGGWYGAALATPGSPHADVYSFALTLYELHSRRGAFGPDAPPTADLLHLVANPAHLPAPHRPPLEPLSTCFDCVRECCVECWNEEPSARPDFKTIRTKLRPLRKGMKPNIFDNMMAMMEKYANNLEVLVDERTDQLQEEKRKTEALLVEMLPAPVAEQLKRGRRVLPESFDCVTIYFSDIVGFTAMSAESTPLQVVDFLNDLYTCFDSILENFDVYKVETIGDAYMVVSGLPIRNGSMHAGEIASMALALLRTTRAFRVRHRPEHRLMLRVGIHSGPVCAGVVGLKMPRYCLFGDTVNTASRFESTGLPLKIHCSAACKRILDMLGGYQLEERGLVPMKGKLDQLTYWLKGEDLTAARERAKERALRRMGAAPAWALSDSCMGEGYPALERGAGDGGSGGTADAAPGAAERRGRTQRSSLKNKHWKNDLGVLHRCCSLESPKKLRFASGSLLESHSGTALHHRSDEYLPEVLSENGTEEESLALPLRHELSSSSCPIIEQSGDVTTMPCDVTLLVNGRSYTDKDESAQPLLINTYSV